MGTRGRPDRRPGERGRGAPAGGAGRGGRTEREGKEAEYGLGAAPGGASPTLASTLEVSLQPALGL